MTDRAWFDAAKGDIPQWAASMPKDADGTTIDWDWVRSLDLAHGVGTIPESTPQSIHDALKADYATRERLESIIAQCNSAFMTDFDRFIGSYRLPSPHRPPASGSAGPYAVRRVRQESLPYDLGHRPRRLLWGT